MGDMLSEIRNAHSEIAQNFFNDQTSYLRDNLESYDELLGEIGDY